MSNIDKILNEGEKALQAVKKGLVTKTELDSLNKTVQLLEKDFIFKKAKSQKLLWAVFNNYLYIVDKNTSLVNVKLNQNLNINDIFIEPIKRILFLATKNGIYTNTNLDTNFNLATGTSGVDFNNFEYKKKELIAIEKGNIYWGDKADSWKKLTSEEITKLGLK